MWQSVFFVSKQRATLKTKKGYLHDSLMTLGLISPNSLQLKGLVELSFQNRETFWEKKSMQSSDIGLARGGEVN